ncbi:hypothetical protein DO72_1557 [Burkholderia pseudomallei]|nr:hypothetical protein DO73_4878 [Burkholderia pseudomallei]KGD35775.1 hypothetical protein DO72_1557 [Burkholderia pseudomallei]
MIAPAIADIDETSMNQSANAYFFMRYSCFLLGCRSKHHSVKERNIQGNF